MHARTHGPSASFSTHTHTLSLSLAYLGPLMIYTAPHQTNPDPLFMSDTHTHTHTHIYIYIYIYTICNAMQLVRLASALEQKTQVYAQTTIIGMGPWSSKRGWGCVVLTD
jgi:hypothetical protein